MVAVIVMSTRWPIMNRGARMPLARRSIWVRAVRVADSPREAEIATLIATAMSNRQIAQHLVLSERTVETHVRSILAKLGFATRTEIATWSLRATR